MYKKLFLAISFLILMSLVVIIPSGSFFLPQYLNNAILSETISDRELTIALDLSLPTAYKLKLSMLEPESAEWYFFAKKSAYFDKKLALQLATLYQIESESDESIFWYKKAIELNHPTAAFKLAEYYLSLNQLNNGKALLLPIVHTKEALIKLIDIAITQGDVEYVQSQLTELTERGAKDLVRILEHYQVVMPKSENIIKTMSIVKNTNSSSIPLACVNSIQLFASNLSNLQRLELLIDEASEHPLFDLFCFEKPKYIPITQLSCLAETGQAISCNESSWDEYAQTINSRYLGVMLDEGGANVNNGILYIDKHDDVNVFTHELSHLLGFIDEYELPSNHVACNSTYSEAFSHNVVILPTSFEGDKESTLRKIKRLIPWGDNIKLNTSILTKVAGKWKVGSPHKDKSKSENLIGLYAVDTCNKENITAFKPVQEVTQLNYYEEPFPTFYSDRAHKEPNVFSMPSYHYNVAKALFKNGEDAKGMAWLSHALKRELVNSLKYKKIKLGEY